MDSPHVDVFWFRVLEKPYLSIIGTWGDDLLLGVVGVASCALLDGTPGS